MVFQRSNPNQTSGHFLISCLEAAASQDDASPEDLTRYRLGFDVYIKQRSYAIINKVFFWLSLLSTLSILLWPLVVIFVLKKYLTILDASVAQTMVTALAAFCIYTYRYYKQRQMAAENVLRQIVFSGEGIEQLTGMIIQELARIDQGFGFRIGSKEGKESRAASGPSDGTA